MPTIKLTLRKRGERQILFWSTDGRSWAKVTEDSPVTGLYPSETLRWQGDRTIRGIQIIIHNDRVIRNADLDGNGGIGPNAKVPGDIMDKREDTYTIKVQPADGGDFEQFDPGLTIPPQ